MIVEKIERPAIDWKILELTARRAPNVFLSKKCGGTVFCHEPYAEELCMLMMGIETSNKELTPGKIMKMIDVHGISDDEMNVSLEGFTNAIIKLDAEKRFYPLLGLTQKEFIENMRDEDWKKTFVRQGYHVKIEGITPYNRASLYAGLEETTKKEFMEQITENTSAYYGKITGKNHGGFVINVRGVDGFLPGSLAATNIVRDFD